MKEIRCDRCKDIVAYIIEGSKIKKYVTLLCGTCSKIRLGAELKCKDDKPSEKQNFNDLFGNIFGNFNN